jgi:hypothetical protein
VDQARRSSHKFPTEAEEDAALIYNYKPTKTSGSFVQEYFFHFEGVTNSKPLRRVKDHGM